MDVCRGAPAACGPWVPQKKGPFKGWIKYWRYHMKVGACIVNKDKRIVGTGYKGMPNRCSDDELPWGKGEGLDNKKHYDEKKENDEVKASKRRLRMAGVGYRAYRGKMDPILLQFAPGSTDVRGKKDPIKEQLPPGPTDCQRWNGYLNSHLIKKCFFHLVNEGNMFT